MGLSFDTSKLEQKLVEIGKKASRELTEKALKEGSEVIMSEQLNNVPIDTGNLYSRIAISKPKGAGTNRKVDVGILNNKDRSATYGYMQEHGTKRMNGKKWMKRSWQNSIEESKNKIADVLAEELLK